MVGRRTKTTLDIRNFVIYHWKKGKLYGETGNTINTHFTTVRNIIKRFENEGKNREKSQNIGK